MPFLSVDVTLRFRGAVRGQSGHLVIGTSPYRAHSRREDAPELDIYGRRYSASSPEKIRKGRGGGRHGQARPRRRMQLLSSTMDKLWDPASEVDYKWGPLTQVIRTVKLSASDYEKCRTGAISVRKNVARKQFQATTSLCCQYPGKTSHLSYSPAAGAAAAFAL